MIDLNLLKWGGGVLAGIAWFVLVLLGKTDTVAFIEFAKLVLIGLGAHGMTLTKPGGEPPATKQAGRISIALLFILFAFIYGFAGCFR